MGVWFSTPFQELSAGAEVNLTRMGVINLNY